MSSYVQHEIAHLDQRAPELHESSDRPPQDDMYDMQYRGNEHLRDRRTRAAPDTPEPTETASADASTDESGDD